MDYYTDIQTTLDNAIIKNFRFNQKIGVKIQFRSVIQKGAILKINRLLK